MSVASEQDQTLSDVASTIVVFQQSDYIRHSLHHLTGNSLSERFDRWLSGKSKEYYQRTADAAEQVIAKSFGGDAVAFKDFTMTLAQTSMKELSFRELVAKGTAGKLVDLQRNHPSWYDAIRAGDFKDVASLDRKIEEIKTSANLAARTKEAPVVAIPLRGAVSSELSCTVRKTGELSCDWNQAQSPLERDLKREATHLLKSGSELLGALSKSISSPPPGSKP